MRHPCTVKKKILQTRTTAFRRTKYDQSLQRWSGAIPRQIRIASHKQFCTTLNDLTLNKKTPTAYSVNTQRSLRTTSAQKKPQANRQFQLQKIKTYIAHEGKRKKTNLRTWAPLLHHAYKNLNAATSATLATLHIKTSTLHKINKMTLNSDYRTPKTC